MERNRVAFSGLLYGIWQILTWALESLTNFNFNGLPLSKVYIVRAKEVQTSYLLWNWREIPNLKTNRVVVLRLIKGIWQILTWALKSLKNFYFNRLLLSKVYIVELKKYRGVIFHKTEKGYKIWRGIELWFQYWHKEFDKFWPERLKVSTIFTLIVSFSAKYILFELKNYRRDLFRETEEGYKIWGGIELWFQVWHTEFDKIWLEHSNVSKIFTLIGSFWAKYILFDLKKYREVREVILHETEERYKIWKGMELWFQNWHKEFEKFWSEHSKVSKIFTLIVFFWAKYALFELQSTEELSFMKLKRDTTFGEKLTFHFKIDISNLRNFDLSTWKSKKFSL